MKSLRMLSLLLILLLLGGSAAYYARYRSSLAPPPAPVEEAGDPASSPSVPTAPPASAPSGPGAFTALVYGKSGHSRQLKAYRINSGETAQPRKIMCVFGIHGFEDAWYRDGEELVKIAQGTLEYFQAHRSELKSYELLIVPCANPDGVYEGWTCEGPGRCQVSLGIDMNMDFDYRFKVRKNTRNLTGTKPFSSPEGAALRDLVLKERPDLIIDFQGWINSAAGDPEVSQVFRRNLGVQIDPWEKVIYPGFFIGWAANYGKAVLVEYPNPYTGRGELDGHNDKKLDRRIDVGQWGFTDQTVRALKEIIDLKL
ncbi:MAG: hypothetical protein HPY50_01640 [Firmicutes bacterium]|nr:hypothetical protein [Bacillota bacterium]